MAGVLYLINILAGAFAIGIVPSMLLTSDPAHNIRTHELLYRSSLLAHLLVTVTNVPMALLFFLLLRVVDRRIALLDVFFTLVGTAVEAAGLLNQFAPLAGAPVVQLQTADYDIYTMFYGFDVLCLGYLVFRSTFLPRVIGILLLIDGAAYLVHTCIDILAPDIASHLTFWTSAAAPLGEGSLCLWLIVFAVNAGRWHAVRQSENGTPRELAAIDGR